MCNPRFKTSDDRGQSWSHYQKLYWGISRGIKNKPLLTSKGWYLLPAYVEFRDHYAIFYLSKDQGKTWKDVEAELESRKNLFPPKRNGIAWLNSPLSLSDSDGSIFCLMRSETSLGKMFQCESLDGGLTWYRAIPSILPNPGGGFFMQKLQSGNIAIIYNHAPAPPLNRMERNPVSIAISEDEGKTWQYRCNLCEFHSDDPENPDELRHTFGYATMTQDIDGKIHATWSLGHPEMIDDQRLNFTDIQYTCFSEDWVKKHPFFEGAFE